MRFRKSTYCVYKTEYHIVWTPRYRRKIFVAGVKQYVEKLLPHIEGLEEDIEVIRVNVQPDHLHIVIVIPPRVSVADVIGYMKAQSSKAIKAKFPFLRKTYSGKEGIWSRGYCVSCIGINEKEIFAYVEYQSKEDRGQLELDLK